MSIGDKPAIVARDAAQVAAIAKQAADTAQQTENALSGVPGVPGKDVAMKVLGGVAIVGGIVSTALTAGTVPAIIVGVAGIASFIAGLLHTAPAK